MNLARSRALTLALLAIGLLVAFAAKASAAPHRSRHHGSHAHSQSVPHHGTQSRSHRGRHGRTHTHSQRPRHRGTMRPK